PACHDWDHTLRVYKNACTLMERTKAVHDASLPTFNELIVKVASLMHDIGRPKELSDCGKTNHAAYGAALAKEWLRAIGVTDNAFIEAVAACIRSHRFRKRDGNTIPATLEERFVYDADKLDSIGAIGIGRSFHFAGRTGARVHNHEDEALSGKSYGREDSAYREYLVKLKDVRNSMLTQAGRQLALHRHDFMVGFFEELNRECFEDL
ncbi:MAG: HD domain-containing protein, partial [Victivallales bacterium]|nr:HD domain-containing protein [Victivallales bacterium]